MGSDQAYAHLFVPDAPVFQAPREGRRRSRLFTAVPKRGSRSLRAAGLAIPEAEREKSFLQHVDSLRVPRAYCTVQRRALAVYHSTLLP